MYITKLSPYVYPDHDLYLSLVNQVVCVPKSELTQLYDINHVTMKVQ